MIMINSDDDTASHTAVSGAVVGHGVRPGHCVFCQKKVRQVKKRKVDGIPEDKDGEVFAANLTPELTVTINQIWPWAVKNKRSKGGGERGVGDEFKNILNDLGEVMGTGVHTAARWLPVPPSVCHSCGVTVGEVGKALKHLWHELEILRKIVEEAFVGGQDHNNELISSKEQREDDEEGMELSEPDFNHDQSDEDPGEQLVNPLKDPLENEAVEEGHHSSTPPPEYDDTKSEFSVEGEDDHEYKYEMSTGEDFGDPVSMEEEQIDASPAQKGQSGQSLVVGDGIKKETGMKKEPKGSGNVSQDSDKPNKAPPVKLHRLPKRRKCRKKEQLELDHIPRLERCTCDLCGKLLSIHTILEHVKGHVGDHYPVPCSSKKCGHIFSNFSAMLEHFKRSHARRKSEKCPEAICDLCGFKSRSGLNFRTHLKHEHERGSDKPFACPLPGCDKRFVVKQSVDWHISTHTELKPVTSQKCDQCDAAQEIVNIEQHLTKVHKCENIISCQQCPCKFSSREALVEHLFVHRFEGMFCDICQDGVKYMKHAELKVHYQKAHELNKKVFLCQFCDKEYELLHSLNKHIRDKHSKAENPAEASVARKRWPCDLCFNSVSFVKKAGLIAHKIRNHGAEPFSCGTCGDKFTKARDLSRHEKEHAGMTFQKEWKCDVEGCGKVFVGDKRNFTRHMKFHQEGKQHVCETCGKRYYNATVLNIHHNTVHLGLRPWVCEICGAGFKGSSALKRHKLIHTGERPFACSICDQRFRQKEVLNTHIRSHEEKGTAFLPSGPMKKIRKRKAQ